MEQRRSCSRQARVFLNQGLNPCPRRQADSPPLSPQGSPAALASARGLWLHPLSQAQRHTKWSGRLSLPLAMSFLRIRACSSGAGRMKGTFGFARRSSPWSPLLRLRRAIGQVGRAAGRARGGSGDTPVRSGPRKRARQPAQGPGNKRQGDTFTLNQHLSLTPTGR